MNRPNPQTSKLLITVTHTKDMPDLTDIAGARLWTVDGVESVTAELVEPVPVDPETFDDKITDFNNLYGLPCLDVPGIPNGMKPAQLDEYLEKLYSILFEELQEVEAIRMEIRAGSDPITVLTELADWLGDMQVYCASELRKFGIPNTLILSIIMASNMSKLGEDGKPIYDERGKVLKGPGYWKPEPQIKRALLALVRQSSRLAD